MCEMCFYGNTDRNPSRGSENSVSRRPFPAVVITSSDDDSFSNRISIFTHVTCRGCELWDWEEGSVHTTSLWKENRLATVRAGFQPSFSLFPLQTHAFLPSCTSLASQVAELQPSVSFLIHLFMMSFYSTHLPVISLNMYILYITSPNYTEL